MQQTLPFLKMHGIGNDFVLVVPEDAQQPLDWPAIARATGDRHFGVGHDGLLLVDRPTDAAADFRMRMYNPDGSESEMCGNGIRCFARYLHDQGMANGDVLTVQTGAGLQRVRVIADGPDAGAVTVDMGPPIFDAARVPVLAEQPVVERQPLVIDGCQFTISCVSMGNPHAVAFVDDIQAVPLEEV